MRLLVALIALVSLLCVNVQADKDAIGFEMLFFYYVYKMDFLSTGSSSMGGSRCHGRRPCGFSDFVKDVMAEEFVDEYDPDPRDLTVNPDSSNLAQFEAVDSDVPRQYRIGRVLEGEDKRVPNAQLVRRVWTIARHARNTGLISSSDMQGAADGARDALAARFYNSRDSFNKALDSFLSPEAKSYLVTDEDNWYNWKQSLANIDAACDKGQISVDKKKDLKNQIKGFSQNIRAQKGAGETARSHLPILQEYQKGITSIQKWIQQTNAKIFDDAMTCKGGITRRSAIEAGTQWLDKGTSIFKRFLNGLPHIGISGARSILAHRIRSEL